MAILNQVSAIQSVVTFVNNMNLFEFTQKFNKIMTVILYRSLEFIPDSSILLSSNSSSLFSISNDISENTHNYDNSLLNDQLNPPPINSLWKLNLNHRSTLIVQLATIFLLWLTQLFKEM